MTAHRTTGEFSGVNEKKDTVLVTIDLEGQKVTGSYTVKSNASIEFAGILENKTITPTKGLDNKTSFQITENNLTVNPGSK